MRDVALGIVFGLLVLLAWGCLPAVVPTWGSLGTGPPVEGQIQVGNSLGAAETVFAFPINDLEFASAPVKDTSADPSLHESAVVDLSAGTTEVAIRQFDTVFFESALFNQTGNWVCRNEWDGAGGNAECVKTMYAEGAFSGVSEDCTNVFSVGVEFNSLCYFPETP